MPQVDLFEKAHEILRLLGDLKDRLTPAERRRQRDQEIEASVRRESKLDPEQLYRKMTI